MDDECGDEQSCSVWSESERESIEHGRDGHESVSDESQCGSN